MIQLEKVKHKYGFDRGLRSSLKNMKQVSIELPIKEDGTIDIDKQKEVIGKYKYVTDLKERIIDYKKNMSTLKLKMSSDHEFKDTKINDIFHFTRGRVISKADVNSNTGAYPVYSSNTLEGGIFGYLETYDFDCDGITWTTDGIYAGTTFFRSGKFSITNVCGLMTLEDKYINDIYLPYVNEVIDLRRIATGSDNKKVMTNVILQENIIIPIPIDSNGNYDMDMQKEIAQQYFDISEIRKAIEKELNKILDSDILLH